MKENINNCIQIDIKKVKHDQISSLECCKDNSFTYLYYLLNDDDCLFELNGNQFEINIVIDNSYFEKYKDSIIIPPGTQELCCNIQSKLLEIINCTLPNQQRYVFIESIILSLLVYSLKNENEKKNSICEGCIFLNKPLEKQKIQRAKEFILNNLNQQLTIPVIARISIGTKPVLP
ncbi:MAG: hypothetical protein U5K51_11845 [Flavobacteriaceae bacterium]|nr:hypothetical protein [Flavobacteriaceae bacterium]